MSFNQIWNPECGHGEMVDVYHATCDLLHDVLNLAPEPAVEHYYGMVRPQGVR
jgi:hypothetical protein